MCKVVNLKTGAEYVYTCDAKEALTMAYRQYELGDWNWWKEPPTPLPTMLEGKHTYSMGDYAVLKEDRS